MEVPACVGLHGRLSAFSCRTPPACCRTLVGDFLHSVVGPRVAVIVIVIVIVNSHSRYLRSFQTTRQLFKCANILELSSMQPAEDGGLVQSRLAFVRTVLLVHELTGLDSQTEGIMEMGQMYLVYNIEPGNMTVASPLFSSGDNFPIAAELELPSSLCVDKAHVTGLSIELFKIQSERHHELMGSCVTTIARLSGSGQKELRLQHKRRRHCPNMLRIEMDILPCLEQLRTEHDALPSITLVALDASGMEKEAEPVISAWIFDDKDAAVSNSNIGVHAEETHVWNHRWIFNLSSSLLVPAVIIFNVRDSAVHDQVFATARISVAELKTKTEAGLCDFCLPFRDPNDEAKVLLTVHIAWTWVKNYVIPVDRIGSSQEHDSIRDVSVCPSQLESDNTLASPTLASQITFALCSLCRLSLHSVMKMEKVIALSKQQRQNEVFQVQLQLLVCGDLKKLNADIPITCVKLVSDHCPNERCAVFDCKSPNLQIPMQPEWATTLHSQQQQDELHQVYVTIKSSSSKVWWLVSEFAIGFALLSAWTTPCGWKYPILDNDDSYAGQLCTVMSCGAVTDAKLSNVLAHDPNPCDAIIQLLCLRRLVPQSDVVYTLLARLWTTSSGPQHSEVLSGLMWMDEDSQGPICHLPVFDTESEIIHVDIYKVHTSCRKEYVGSGMFQCRATTKCCESNSIESQVSRIIVVNLAPKGKQSAQIAKARFCVTIKKNNNVPDPQPDSTLFSSSFRNTSTAFKCCEGRSWLFVNVEKLQLYAEIYQNYEAVQVEFSLATKQRWTATTSWVTTLHSGIVKFDEKCWTQIFWSSKDRCIPMLQLRIKAHQQYTPNMKRLGNGVSIKAQRKKNVDNSVCDSSTAVVLGTYLLDLSAFFSQPRVWTRLKIPVSSGTKESIMQQEVATLITMGVLVSDTENQIENHREEAPRASIVNGIAGSGDICVHLQQATGTFLQSESAYFVRLSLYNEQTATSKLARINQTGTITWDEYLTIAVMCEASPVVELSIYKNDRSDTKISCIESPVATARFPLLDIITTKQHLMHLDLSLVVPSSYDNRYADTDSECFQYIRKIGVITVDVQFVVNEPAKAKLDNISLVISGLRGEICPISAAFVILDVYAMRDLGNGKMQRIGTSSRLVVALTRVSTSVSVNECLELSLFELSDGSDQVIVVEIRDMHGTLLLVSHIPLRTGWRKRLLAPNSKERWYKLVPTQQHASGTGAFEDAAVLLGFRRESKVSVNRTFQDSIQFCLQMINAIAQPKLSATESGVIYAEVEGRRTRKAVWNSNIHTCRWNDDWIFLHQTPDGIFKLTVTIECGSKSFTFTGDLNLSSITSTQTCISRDDWVILVGNNDMKPFHPQSLFLLVRVVALPPMAGTIEMDVRNLRLISPSQSSSDPTNIDGTYLACTNQNKSDIAKMTRLSQDSDFKVETALRVTVNTATETSLQSPMLLLRLMTHSDVYGDICSGCCSVDLSFCIQHTQTPSDSTWRWLEFRDRIDQSKLVAIFELRATFIPFANSISSFDDRIDHETSDRSDERAEMLAIWKKLFYMLDVDGNEVVDLDEFTNLFTNASANMIATSDGKSLLDLLFGPNETSISPTVPMIQTLFAEMDIDDDKLIRWNEYLAFLHRRQQKFGKLAAGANHSAVGNQIQIQNAAQHHSVKSTTNELRRKTREDPKHPKALSGAQMASAPTQHDDRKTTASVKRPEQLAFRKTDTNLQTQIDMLKTDLELEKQKYSKLHAEWQTLQRSYQQLHLKQQQEAVEKQVRAKHAQEAILRQEDLLRARDAQKKKQHDASIILQSSLRLRLEQRRYHGMKILRTHAAITLQCFFRQTRAVRVIGLLKVEKETHFARMRAAKKLQGFVHYHLRRKRMQLLVDARKLSSQIIQKHVRGRHARKQWMSKQRYVILIQSWCRRSLANRETKLLRHAITVIRWFLRGWLFKRRYCVARTCASKIAHWWRRSQLWRARYLEEEEAAICIQASWRCKLVHIQYQRMATNYSNTHAITQDSLSSVYKDGPTKAEDTCSLQIDPQQKANGAGCDTTACIDNKPENEQMFQVAGADETYPQTNKHLSTILSDPTDIVSAAAATDLTEEVQRVLKRVLLLVEENATASDSNPTFGSDSRVAVAPSALSQSSNFEDDSRHDAAFGDNDSPTLSCLRSTNDGKNGDSSTSDPERCATEKSVSENAIAEVDRFGTRDLHEIESVMMSVLANVAAVAGDQGFVGDTSSNDEQTRLALGMSKDQQEVVDI